MNRQEDLSKVFDRTWTANHNDVAKRGRERERKFMNRMFGRKDNTEISHTTNNNLTPGMRVTYKRILMEWVILKDKIE